MIPPGGRAPGGSFPPGRIAGGRRPLADAGGGDRRAGRRRNVVSAGEWRVGAAAYLLAALAILASACGGVGLAGKRRGGAGRRGSGRPAGTGRASRLGAGRRFGARAGGGALAARCPLASRRSDVLRGGCGSVRRTRHGSDGGGVSRRRGSGVPQCAGSGARRRTLALLLGAPAPERGRARGRGRPVRGGAPIAAGRHGDPRLAGRRPPRAGRCRRGRAAVLTGPAALLRFALRPIRTGPRGP